ncbi:cyclophilin-like fold protein [Diaminobutyricibacter sp. McL0618]|uniref:cyclophilin-like fold protein n=1 Tax=Leifsonia sp. McL0618 TaxID=3415677 RepID=UPI003CE7C466
MPDKVGCPVGTPQSRDSREPTRRRSVDSVIARIFFALAAAVLSLGALTASPPSATVSVSPIATVRLNSSSQAIELSRELPLSTVMNDRMGTALMTDLPTPLNMDRADSVQQFHRGDVAYWATAQKLVVFKADVSAVPDRGLVLVGQVGAGADTVAECVTDCRLTLRSGRD